MKKSVRTLEFRDLWWAQASGRISWNRYRRAMAAVGWERAAWRVLSRWFTLERRVSEWVWSHRTPRQRLRRQLRYALAYEEMMERALASSPGFQPYPFMPASKRAYRRALAVLAKRKLGPEDLDRVHAALMEVFSQQHYNGIVLQDMCRQVDRWLQATEPHAKGRPSLVQAYEDYPYHATLAAGPLPQWLHERVHDYWQRRSG